MRLVGLPELKRKRRGGEERPVCAVKRCRKPIALHYRRGPEDGAPWPICEKHWRAHCDARERELLRECVIRASIR